MKEAARLVNLLGKHLLRLAETNFVKEQEHSSNLITLVIHNLQCQSMLEIRQGELTIINNQSYTRVSSKAVEECRFPIDPGSDWGCQPLKCA